MNLIGMGYTVSFTITVYLDEDFQITWRSLADPQSRDPLKRAMINYHVVNPL